MSGQTVILRGASQRDFARHLISLAPQDAVVTVRAATRTNDQNALMWALLSDVSRAKPQGRCHTSEVWKALFMHACGHATQFQMGLDGQPFPVGFRTSNLSKGQMSDLIEFILAWGSENGVRWSDEARVA
ncbi:recombination protein NinB [Falsirhodobacter halotolerans]|uniref:recombination protein NinB n=1 Tax=Falsirhodobacter halotolerans TaxID=1146892 RepID=UPI001FD40189|nr:recombination protein NinB [Falsirhodobacter halotolerans]MCJ8138569.1 recombination protein NinB [Falsirhodobacter halotolerans]